MQTEFTLEEALHLLDEAQACGIHEITITGGEPMLHPQFMKIMRGIYERDMYVHDLNTNGQFITQEVLDEFKTFGCNPLMKISFDGLGHHDWLRAHQGAEADAIRAIKLCIQNGFAVKVQTNVHRKNMDSILKTADYMDSLGVKEMRIIRTTESPRWTQNAGDACLDLEEYYDVMLDFTKQYLQKPHKMEIDIWQFLMFYPQHRTYHHRPVVGGWGPQRLSVPVCKGNRGMVAVASNGNVVPCHQMSGYYEQHGQCLGNVKTVGLQKLLSDSSYLDAVCTPISAVVEHSEQCKNCKYLNLCLGGCRAIALALTGDKLAHDPAKCLFFNKGYLKKVTDLFNSLSAGEAKYRCMDDLGDIN
ncbi:MAG: radical SAM protein [Hungatella sp.]